MGDVVFLTGALVAVAAGMLTPIFILVKSVETYRLANRDRAVYVFRAMLALGVWCALSLGMMFLMFVYVYSSAHSQPDAPADWSWLTVYIFLTAGYGLVGLVLVRWMTRQE